LASPDQFGGELQYFPECILEGRSVEPDGDKGLADLLVIEAIVEARRSGRPVKFESLARTLRIDPDEQEQRLGPVAAPEPVNTLRQTRPRNGLILPEGPRPFGYASPSDRVTPGPA
jgi:hypothetical protein